MIRAAPVLSLGSLCYLASVGLVGVGVVAVFFSAGFLLLVPPAGGTRPAVADPAPSADLGDARPSTAIPPPPPADQSKQADDTATTPRVQLDAAILKPARNENAAAVAAPAPTGATAAAPPKFGLPAAELAELLQHGDALLRTGDVASARLFYERAANAGDGRAALRLGATFDPGFLARAGLAKLQADAAEARLWYSRALDLGMPDAKRQLNSLDTKQGR